MIDLGYDIYAAAREEYRKKIAEQADEIERLRAALYDCMEVTAKHHAEDQARVQTGGSDMASRKAKAILSRSSLLFGKIRKITRAALGVSDD